MYMMYYYYYYELISSGHGQLGTYEILHGSCDLCGGVSIILVVMVIGGGG